MNGKVVKRIKKAIDNLPALSEVLTITVKVLGKDIPKETLDANPGKFNPKFLYPMTTKETKPINHLDRAKDAFNKGGHEAVAEYVKEMELKGADIKKAQKKAAAAPGAIERQFRDHSII